MHVTADVALGNNDRGLDKDHKEFMSEVFDLFTSPAARQAGFYYLARATASVATVQPDNVDGEGREDAPPSKPLRVYGNPSQPDFLLRPDGSHPYPNPLNSFIYLPDPSAGCDAAWSSAPPDDGPPVWVTHCPPKGRRDWTPFDWLRGCTALARAVARARPVLHVFGHYHDGRGVELVTWGAEGDGEMGGEGAAEGKNPADGVEVELLADNTLGPCYLDFTGPERRFRRGEKTIFVNAAWMTLQKSKVPERYQPIVLDLPANLLA